MSQLSELKSKASEKLATVHADVMTYISALEGKVQSNRNVWFGVAAAVAVIVVLVAVHHCKHG